MLWGTGVWIDHREAILVSLTEQGDEIKRIESHTERHGRYSGAGHSRSPAQPDYSAEDKRDRRVEEHLHHYYDEVIMALHDADAIVILGPGEAKLELQKRLAEHPADKNERPITVVEAADKMTDNQIVAEVRRHFHR